MHSGITGWNARASCTVYRNLPRPHLDQGISGRILDALHTLGFMQICFLHARSLSAAPAPVGTASKDPGHRLRRRVWQARTRNRTTNCHFFEEQLKKKALVGNNLNAVLVVGRVSWFPSGMAACNKAHKQHLWNLGYAWGASILLLAGVPKASLPAGFSTDLGRG